MGTLCQGLNHLDRETARRLYEQRLQQQRSPAPLLTVAAGRSLPESQDSDWLDNLDQADWEDLMGGPEESAFESLFD